MNYPAARTSMSLRSRISPTFIPPQLASLDHWQVRRHLGSGASAHVWLLEEITGSRAIACKTPRTPEDQIVLSQEADLARSLSHEHLVRPVQIDPQSELSQVQRAGATLWQFLPAGSLASLIAAAGPLSLAQTVTVLLPMVQAASYLHAQQIVHGDLSPANILFDLDGRPVLIDLGAVRATGHAFSRTGTLGFTAPEITASGDDHQGLAVEADVYSLAAIGWFCLTGAAPGPPQSRMPLVMLRPDLHPEIASVLESCLSAEPTLRLPLSQLLTAIAQWSDPEPVDLFASAGEEFELLLATRKPQHEPQSGRRKRRRQRTDRSHKSLDTDAGGLERVRARRRRLVLSVSASVLLAGTVMTTHYVTQVAPQPGVSEETIQPETEDFQAVVDWLAKTRSHAWATAEEAQVADYAVRGSDIFEADVQVLAALHTAGMTLDGIRMRGVVESVEHADESAAITVEWRTDAYIQRDASEDAIEHVEHRTERLVLHLVDTSAGWRLSAVQVA